jgi:hypothetical protein
VVLKRRSFVKCFRIILISIPGLEDTEYILAALHQGHLTGE